MKKYAVFPAREIEKHPKRYRFRKKLENLKRKFGIQKNMAQFLDLVSIRIPSKNAITNPHHFLNG